jgi:hypothetical protein
MTRRIKENNKNKPFVFVLMPFAAGFKNIYRSGIKAACESIGVDCGRVDEQTFTESILRRVYSEIAQADIIVAEMTGCNPNVFYEVGYAHALDKQVVLLTRDAEDIPFDLKHYPHIIHNGSISKLRTELTKRILGCLDNTDRSLPIDAPDISGLWQSYHSLNRNAKPIGEVRFKQRGKLIEADIKAFRSRNGRKTNKQFKLNGKLVSGQLAFIYEDANLPGYVIGAGVLKLSGDSKNLIGKITYFHQDKNSLEAFNLRLQRP